MRWNMGRSQGSVRSGVGASAVEQVQDEMSRQRSGGGSFPDSRGLGLRRCIAVDEEIW